MHSVFTNNHRVKHPERKNKGQMRGKSKINVLLFWGPNWNLQGKKIDRGLEHR